MPIREEIVAREGDSVITRNAYGARCLNTPRALFVDIDFHDPGPDRALRWGCRVPLLMLAAGIGGAAGSWLVGLLATGIALALGAWIARRIHAARRNRDGGPAAAADRRIEAFVRQHPAWRLRQYATPAGVRLLALHRGFDPREQEVAACFAALGADPVFALMCVRQRCFRARVSPKPWRIGIERHIRPRPGTWPIDPARMPERRRWIEDYERRAEGFAACRYVRTLGEGAADPAIDAVRALHDALCRAERVLPLA